MLELILFIILFFVTLLFIRGFNIVVGQIIYALNWLKTYYVRLFSVQTIPYVVAKKLELSMASDYMESISRANAFRGGRRRILEDISQHIANIRRKQIIYDKRVSQNDYNLVFKIQVLQKSISKIKSHKRYEYSFVVREIKQEITNISPKNLIYKRWYGQSIGVQIRYKRDNVIATKVALSTQGKGDFTITKAQCAMNHHTEKKQQSTTAKQTRGSVLRNSTVLATHPAAELKTEQKIQCTEEKDKYGKNQDKIKKQVQLSVNLMSKCLINNQELILQIPRKEKEDNGFISMLLAPEEKLEVVGVHINKIKNRFQLDAQQDTTHRVEQEGQHLEEDEECVTISLILGEELDDSTSVSEKNIYSGAKVFNEEFFYNGFEDELKSVKKELECIKDTFDRLMNSGTGQLIVDTEWAPEISCNRILKVQELQQWNSIVLDTISVAEIKIEQKLPRAGEEAAPFSKKEKIEKLKNKFKSMLKDYLNVTINDINTKCSILEEHFYNNKYYFHENIKNLDKDKKELEFKLCAKKK